jgi:GlpG protein
MRQIGSISSLDDAERFADYLRAEGVRCSIDSLNNGYRIWVQEDDHVEAAKKELPRFLAEPNHERYRDAASRANARLQEDQLRQRATRVQTVDVAEKWSRPTGENCPMTYALIAISVVVAYFTWPKPNFNDPNINRLFFSADGTFQPILNGEIWRLITPIFLHFNLMHILFNMIMTYQLGLEIERLRGSLKFIGMVIVIAALSNAGQFWFNGRSLHGQWFGNPLFGGMSGVDYGLFGYIWIKGRLDPDSGFDLPQQTVTTMLVWYVLCVLNVIPNVANWCHGIGMVTGVAIAAIGTWAQPLFRRK